VAAVLGEVHTFPAKVPPVAVQVRLSVAPPEAVAVKVCVPGAIVWLAGEMLEIVTLVGVTVQVAEADAPPVPVTDNVYVLVEVSAGVGYELPLTADVVISKLPTPVDPITAVPPENVGMRVMEEL
jgi:hypothetical protein